MDAQYRSPPVKPPRWVPITNWLFMIVALAVIGLITIVWVGLQS